MYQFIVATTVALFGAITWLVMQPFNLDGTEVAKFLVVFLLFPGLALIAITLYAHRQETHGAITLHPVLAFLFRCFIFVLGMKVWEWVAVHLIHHKYSDTERDPHSPLYKGFWKVYLWTAGLFNQAKKYDQEVRELIAEAEAELDWWGRNVFRHSVYGPIIVLPLLQLIILFAGFGWDVKVLWLLYSWPMAILVFLWGGGTINAAGHTSKLRNLLTGDFSKNPTWILRFLTFGEGNHYWHHLVPGSAQFNPQGWKDLAWCFIFVLKRLRLVTIHHVGNWNKPRLLRRAA